jgi:hypothetical protein
MTDDHDSDAERRLDEHLAVLRTGAEDEPGDQAAFVRGLVRTARWQRAARQPLWLAGVLLGALGEGAALLSRSAGRRS